VLGFTPTLGQSGVATYPELMRDTKREPFFKIKEKNTQNPNEAKAQATNFLKKLKNPC
jgi:hypothetical protein